MKKKRFITSVISLALVLGCCLNFTVLAMNEVDSTEMTRNSSHRQNVLIIDWNDCYEVMIGCEPIVKNDDVFVPVSELMTVIDYKELSKNNENSVAMSNGNREITITPNSKNAIVDQKSTTLSNTIYSEDDLLYINIEDLEKLFSYDVSYDSKNNNIVLTVTDDTPKPVKTITPPNMLQGVESPRTVNVIVGDTELQIEADNKPVVFPDMKPFIDDQDRTQIPIRALAEMLNCQVIWDQQTHGITIIDVDGTVVTIEIGDNKIFVDGKMVEMDTIAKIINNRAYLPLRFVSEALGLNVYWEYAN